MPTPQRTLSGVCEISTGAFTVEEMPPAYTGEVAALKVDVQFTMDGQPSSADGATVEMYLFYETRRLMTKAVKMSVSGNRASGTLGVDDFALDGAPLLVIRMTDTQSGEIIVACAVVLVIQDVLGVAVISTRPATPSETVYVGRAPYIDDTTYHWYVWDNETAQYVDSGVNAYGGQTLEEIMNAEKGRVEAEKQRVTDETARADAERLRADAETARDTAEKARNTAEEERDAAEKKRAEAETKRADDEAARVEAEKKRAEAESARVSAETERQKQSSEATKAANDAADYIKNATYSAEKVAAGGTPYAKATDEDGHLHITYGVVTGDKGEQGKSFSVLGDAFPTLDALKEAVTKPEIGDQYNVGTAQPYHIYRWTGTTWEDQGVLQGPDGKDGKDGATFTPSVDEDGNLSFTNDKSLPNPDPVNIKGPKGDTGLYLLEVDARGHLLCHYVEGEIPPAFSIDTNGHLIYTFEEV